MISIKSGGKGLTVTWQMFEASFVKFLLCHLISHWVQICYYAYRKSCIHVCRGFVQLYVFFLQLWNFLWKKIICRDLLCNLFFWSRKLEDGLLFLNHGIIIYRVIKIHLCTYTWKKVLSLIFVEFTNVLICSYYCG